MKKYFCLLLSFFLTGLLSAQTNDDNIIITNQTETYEYFIRNGQVMVKQTQVTNYECTRMSASIYVSEMYDNESTIDKVNIKGIKGVKPSYNLYTSGEIFYTDAKVCHFKLPFNMKGNTAEVEIVKTFKNPRYFTAAYFPDKEFIRRKEIQFIIPEWMNVELNEYNFDGHCITKTMVIDRKSNTHTYTYVIKEVAAAKQEPAMQGPSYIYPHIFVVNKSATINGQKEIFFETIADRYRWCYDIVNQTENDAAIISTKAKEIVEGCGSDLEKIKAIFGWVQDNIRYVAFEDGIAGFKPDSAQEVLRKKYGDCKGMANLLKNFLTAQGFDARLSWIGTKRIAYDYSIPSLAVDNHMICTLFYNGAIYYLDATVEYMPLGEYPQTIQGRQVMIEDGEKFIINRIPLFPPQLNTDSLSCHYTIVNDVLKGKARWQFNGETKQVIMSLIHATAKSELSNALKLFVERKNVQDKASDIELQNATAQSDHVDISYKIENRSGLQKPDDEYYIDLNADKELLTQIINLKKRTNNILMPYRRNIVKHITLEIPKGYKVSHLPEKCSIIHPKYEFSIDYEVKGSTVIYKNRIIILDPLILKSEFETWNSNIEQMKKHYLEQLVLVKI